MRQASSPNPESHKVAKFSCDSQEEQQTGLAEFLQRHGQVVTEAWRKGGKAAVGTSCVEG